MAFHSPSGLTGRPENEEGFTKVSVDDITIFVDNQVLKEYAPDLKELKFLVPEYGWYHITFINE